MYRNIKYLGLTLVMLLGLYPIAELTRVIIVSGEFYFPNMKGQFVAEIAVMWILYLSIAPVFMIFNNHTLRHYHQMRKKFLKRKKVEDITALAAGENMDYIRVDYKE